MAFVYIIHSLKLDRYYVGSTGELLSTRLERHNSKYYENKFTSKGIPWTLFFSLECLSRAQAEKIEKHIKQMKSKAYIENLKRYPEMAAKLLEKFHDPESEPR